jgi:GNAT superfamily N-acetyltransferase
MSADSVLVARTADLAAVRRLGVACGLEDSGRGDERIEAAWGAFAGERLVGAIVLEHLRGLETANWMAVDDAYRRRGIASRLYAALECEARHTATASGSRHARRPSSWRTASPRWRLAASAISSWVSARAASSSVAAASRRP